jgi:hypothetical protein
MVSMGIRQTLAKVKMKKLLLYLVAVIVIGSVLYYWYTKSHLTPSKSTEYNIIEGTGGGTGTGSLFHIDSFSRSETNDAVLLPNHTFTPGKVRLDATVDEVCNTSTKQFRHTTSSMKKQVYALYGVVPHAGVCMDVGHTTRKGKEVSESCEVDHLISLELGGADDVGNLWPQPYDPPNDVPGAHAKDKVENWLHAQVCSGKMDLKSAQDAIAKDWYRIYLDNGLENK